MTREQVLDILAKAGDNLLVNDYYEEGREIFVYVEDFGGFDENWNEIDLEYDEALVAEVESEIEAAAISVSGDFYRYYQFDDFKVIWGMASFDI